MSRQAAITRFRARNGQGSAGAPNILSVADVPQRPPLYLLVETTGDDSLSAQIIFAVDETYRRARGSLTGALQQVARAAADVLAGAPGTLCGLTALIVQKDEALLAQSGPAACWLLRDGQLMRFPPESVWLDADTPSDVLRYMGGGPGDTDPDLSRISLHRGDKLLIATSSVARDAGELLIAEAMAEADPGAALHRLAPDIDFSALSIEPFVAAGSRPTTPAVRPVRPAQPTPITPPRPATVAPPPERPVVRAPSPSAAAAPGQPRMLRLTPPAAPDDEPDDAPGRTITLPAINWWAIFRPVLEVLGDSLLLILGLLRSAARFVWDVMTRALPEHPTQAPGVTLTVRRTQSAPGTGGGGPAALFAVGIAVAVVFAAAYVISQNSISNATRYNEIVRTVNDQITATLSIGDAAVRRQELEKLLALTEDANKIESKEQIVRGTRPAQELKRRIQEELDRLNKATRVYFHPEIQQFTDAGSRPSALAARGNEVYALDSGLNRLHKVLLNDARDNIQPTPTPPPTPTPQPTYVPNPVIMRQGDERGAIVVGPLADIFWGTTGGGRVSTGLLTLTAQRQVIEYAPARGINVLQIANVPGWQEATFGESFNGSLYVLDAKSNRIFKFAPTGEDYKAAPVDYLAAGRVDLTGATGLAVDGFVWVVRADGAILKFDGGVPVAFEKRGLDTPLRNPSAIVALPNSPSLWVADAGNKRIVQFSKAGDFAHQYIAAENEQSLNDLRAIAVDEAAKRIYWLSGNTLYLTAIAN